MPKRQKTTNKTKLGRCPTGAGLVVLVMILGIFILGVIGLFGFEVTRSSSARDELRSACESAALAGAAALASSNTIDPTTGHNNAQTAAQQAFVINTILGNLLSDTVFQSNQYSSSGATGQPSAGQTALRPNEVLFYLNFLDTSGNSVAWNDPKGQTVNVSAVYGYEPSFAKYVGIGLVPVTAGAKAKVPKMDIVMCFDVSGSIDDQSKVTFVKRYWHGSQIAYDIAKYTDGSPANGTIFALTNPPKNGSPLNLERPQVLNGGGPMTFNTGLRQGPAGKDSGDPPGNYPSGGGTGSPQDFTDVVANLDGNNVFSPPYNYTDTAGRVWQFPTLGAVVEASRGNLENQGVFSASKADSTLSGIVQPRAGYQAAYWQAAHNLAEPIADARAAATRFFQIMNNDTDARFGFVSFASPPVATTPTGTAPVQPAISSNYPPGGTVTPPYPGQTLGANNLNTIVNTVIPKTVAWGGTDIGDACQEAVNELVSGGRPDAVQIVVFFTDGLPNAGPAWNAAASQAHSKGIAIYTVGLAQNAQIIPTECDNLNDQAGKSVSYTDPITGASGSYTPATDGMSAVAGNGGKFFLATSSKDLNYIFENIARHLVQIAKY